MSQSYIYETYFMEYTLFFLLLFILENTAAHTIILDKAKVVKEKTEEKMIKIAEKKRLEENIILAESDIEIALPNLFQKDMDLTDISIFLSKVGLLLLEIISYRLKKNHISFCGAMFCPMHCKFLFEKYRNLSTF